MDLRTLMFWRRPDRCAKCAEYETTIARLKSINYKDDSVNPIVADAAFDGAAVKLFAASAVHWFKETGGENFVTLDMSDPKTGEHYEVTMQKCGGMTPAQKLAKLEDAIMAIADDGWLMHGAEGMDEAQQKVWDIVQTLPQYQRRLHSSASENQT